MSIALAYYSDQSLHSRVSHSWRLCKSHTGQESYSHDVIEIILMIFLFELFLKFEIRPFYEQGKENKVQKFYSSIL